MSYGTFTQRVIELLKSWRTSAELDSDFIFDFTERTFERIAHRVVGSDTSPKDLRKLAEFHIKDDAVEQWALVKAFLTLMPSELRSGELFHFKEETHRYNTGLEHGFAHPDLKVTRHVKHQRLSGFGGKGVDR
jgi:hypothetical protein